MKELRISEWEALATHLIFTTQTESLHLPQDFAKPITDKIKDTIKDKFMKSEKLYAEEKDNLWGGKRLIDSYGKAGKNGICAESWELSFHPDGPSRLKNGKLLCEAVSEKELGENTRSFEMFPMMIKLIDAKENLSVQVHPNDEYALKNENSYGKTEMWYIVEADEGAGIYLGFKRDVSREEVESAIKENTLVDLMNFFEVKAGDCFFIPSGTIHAIGAGCLIYEIQQNSNITYRVYDYGRKDKNGNTRELHVEKALAVLNYSSYIRTEADTELLGISKYFTARRVKLSEEAKVFEKDDAGFRCITVVNGCGALNENAINKGDSYFIPATENEFTLSGNLTAILAEIRQYGLKINNSATKCRAELFDDLGRTVYYSEAENENEAVEKLLNKANITLSDLTLL